MTRRAAIIGVGLMGGSLGMALRSRGWRVTGVGRDKARLRRAGARGALDEVSTDAAAGVAGADVVVLAVPVDGLIPLGRRLRPHVKPGALVTDMGSVKGDVARAFADWPDFVGAHPMCGSEKTGVENARHDLFRGATCALTPSPRTSRAALAKAESFWRGVGARTLRLAPDVHDRRVALVSHLPHLLAEALVSAVEADGGKAWAPALAAGSFRDATRVAGADPALWAPIFAMNKAAVRRSAALFQKALGRLLAQGPSEKSLARVRRAHAAVQRGSKT